MTSEATKRSLINNMHMALWLIEVTDLKLEVKFELRGSEATCLQGRCPYVKRGANSIWKALTT